MAADLRRAGAEHVVLETAATGCASWGGPCGDLRQPASAGRVGGRAAGGPGLLPAGRRAHRNAVRFPGVPTLAAIVPAVRRLAPPSAPGAVPARARRADRGARAPADHRRRPGRAGVGGARDRRVALDAGRRRRAEPPGRGAGGGRALPRPGARELRIGPVTYADRPHIVESPSSDHDEARAVLDGLVADGGTATGDALQAALDTLDEQGARRPPAAIVLLSDGQSTLGSDPVAVARTARPSAGADLHGRARHPRAAAVQRPTASLPVPPDPEALRRSRSLRRGGISRAGRRTLDSVYERLGSQLGTRRRSARSRPGSPGRASSCSWARSGRRSGGAAACRDHGRHQLTCRSRPSQ